MRTMLKSKIHMAHVTESNINYEESLTIDKTLMSEADILPYEVVQVFNINSGARIQTYAIEGKPDSGIICANGATARLIHPTDKVIILTFYNVSEEEALNSSPKIVFVDENNVITGSRSSNNNGHTNVHGGVNSVRDTQILRHLSRSKPCLIPRLPLICITMWSYLVRSGLLTTIQLKLLHRFLVLIGVIPVLQVLSPLNGIIDGLKVLIQASSNEFLSTTRTIALR